MICKHWGAIAIDARTGSGIKHCAGVPKIFRDAWGQFRRFDRTGIAQDLLDGAIPAIAGECLATMSNTSESC